MISNYIKDYNEIEKSIWIGTIPRSRSSMLAGIFVRCNAFAGHTSFGWHNGRGLYENPIISNACFFETLENNGGVAGLLKLSQLGKLERIKNFKELFTMLMNFQGYKNGATVFKHAVHMFFVDQIMEDFPNSVWIFPKRNLHDVLDSHIRTWNLSDEEVIKYIKIYKSQQDFIKEKYPDNSFEVDTDNICIDGEFANIRNIVHNIKELEWNEEKVKKWVNCEGINKLKPAVSIPRNSTRGFWI